MKNPPKHLTKLLWEYDVVKLTKESPIVLERTLSFGDSEDIKYVGLSNLKKYFKQKKPMIDPKSHNFWSVIFDIKNSSPPPSLYEQINNPTPTRSFK